MYAVKLFSFLILEVRLSYEEKPIPSTQINVPLFFNKLGRLKILSKNVIDIKISVLHEAHSK